MTSVPGGRGRRDRAPPAAAADLSRARGPGRARRGPPAGRLGSFQARHPLLQLIRAFGIRAPCRALGAQLRARRESARAWSAVPDSGPPRCCRARCRSRTAQRTVAGQTRAAALPRRVHRRIAALRERERKAGPGRRTFVELGPRLGARGSVRCERADQRDGVLERALRLVETHQRTKRFSFSNTSAPFQLVIRHCVRDLTRSPRALERRRRIAASRTARATARARHDRSLVQMLPLEQGDGGPVGGDRLREFLAGRLAEPDADPRAPDPIGLTRRLESSPALDIVGQRLIELAS